MIDNIRAVLSPLLIVSYVFGTKIVEFPAGKPRLWLSVPYILLLWSVYHSLLSYVMMFYIRKLSIMFQICYCLNVLTALSSVVLGTYYDKKFRTCLKKLAIVDDTLEKLGSTTNYQKLYARILLIVVGFLALTIWIASTNAIGHGEYSDVAIPFYITYMIKYPTYVNLIDDLIVMSMLGYIGLKFDQINQHLQKMENGNKHIVKQDWENSMLLPRQIEYWTSKNNEYIIWILTHLHLELRKISRELNSMFGLQMTVKMGTYFALIVLASYITFNIIFGEMKKLKLILIAIFVMIHISRLFVINYICEKVSNKANVTGDVINKIPYSSYDNVVQENISQLLVQMRQAPLKFYGLGLFQFGLNFFYGFSSSAMTVIVILVQSHTNT